MIQNINQIKQNALLMLELSPDIKNQVINSNLNKFQTDLKRIAARKKVIILVLEK